MKRVKISCGRISFDAELYDTKTVRMMINAFPLTGNANFFGDEIYFPVPFTAEPEPDAQEEVEIGTIAYWPPSKAFCMFFGSTPASITEKPRGYSAVNICGRILGDLSAWKSIAPGEQIKVDFAEED